MLKALSQSKDRGVRKMAVDGLIKMAEQSRVRVRQILDDPEQPWFLHRNALLILGHIGHGQEDKDRVRKFLRAREGRLREEALSAAVRLEGPAAEPLALAAITDPDAKMQRRALAALANFVPPSLDTISRLTAMLAAPVPKNRDEAAKQEKKTALVARALGTVNGLDDYGPIEAALVAAVRERVKKSGLLSRLRKTMEDEDDPWVAMAAVDSLAKVGGRAALECLAAIGEDQGELSKKSREAEGKIKARLDRT